MSVRGFVDAHSDIIHMLIDHNADVNCRVHYTGIMIMNRIQGVEHRFTMQRRRIEMVRSPFVSQLDVIRILIYHGARLDIVDSEGKLPLQWMNDLRN